MVSLVVFWLELVLLVELVILLSVIVSGAVQHFLPHQHLTFLSHKFPPGSDSAVWEPELNAKRRFRGVGSLEPQPGIRFVSVCERAGDAT